MKCELCNIDVPDIKFLNRHMSNIHKGLDRKLYYDTYLKKEYEGICKNCGCETKYINLIKGYEELCHNCAFSTSHTKICIICGEQFVSRDKRKIICNKSSCIKKYNHNRYKNIVTTCICSICGKTYKATIKQSKDKCKDCIKRTRKYCSEETFKQIIGCKFCGKPIKIIIKHKTKRSKAQINSAICDDCRELHKENIKQRMKLNNPSYKGNNLTIEEYNEKQLLNEYYQSDEYKLNKKQELRKKLSEYMKTNNPMFNKDISTKVGKTLKEKYKNGEIIPLCGKDRWNYKGTRTISGYIRLSLTDWIKENLVRTNYTCERCGAHGVILHVHHIQPFHNILQLGLVTLNLDVNTIKYKDENYNNLEKWILNYHNLNKIGIVVCRKCHAAIDNRYFAPKKLYDKEEIDNEINQ